VVNLISGSDYSVFFITIFFSIIYISRKMFSCTPEGTRTQVEGHCIRVLFLQRGAEFLVAVDVFPSSRRSEQAEAQREVLNYSLALSKRVVVSGVNTQ
jgi:hypothetical protein